MDEALAGNLNSSSIDLIINFKINMKYEEAKQYLKVGMTVRFFTNKCHPSFEGKIVKVDYVDEGAKFKGSSTTCYLLGSFGYDNENELEILTNPDGTRWIKPNAVSEQSESSATPKFKVGDRVRVLKTSVNSVQQMVGQVLTITRVEPASLYPYSVDIGPFVWRDDELEKIEDAPKFRGMTIDEAEARDFTLFSTHWFREYLNNNEPQAQKKGIFMNIVDKIKNFNLTPEDRILRENGLETDRGEMTNEAQELMDDEAQKERWATRRLEIAADLLKIKAEEK